MTTRPPRRASHPGWRSLAGPTVVVVGLVGGCTGGGPAQPDTPSPASSPLAQSADQVYSSIVLRGPSEERPLYWRLEAPDDPRAAEAVTVTQHYEALVETIFQRDERFDAALALLPYLATGQERERIEGYVAAPPAAREVDFTGPRWITLLDAAATGTEARVVFCYDLGHWGDGASGAARPEGDRASVLAYRLVPAPEPERGPAWRVDRTAYRSVPVADPALALSEEQVEEHERRCDRWAVHTPDDR